MKDKLIINMMEGVDYFPPLFVLYPLAGGAVIYLILIIKLISFHYGIKYDVFNVITIVTIVSIVLTAISTKNVFAVLFYSFFVYIDAVLISPMFKNLGYANISEINLLMLVFKMIAVAMLVAVLEYIASYLLERRVYRLYNNM